MQANYTAKVKVVRESPMWSLKDINSSLHNGTKRNMLTETVLYYWVCAVFILYNVILLWYQLLLCVIKIILPDKVICGN